jgi:hypothetical protein
MVYVISFIFFLDKKRQKMYTEAPGSVESRINPGEGGDKAKREKLVVNTCERGE